MKKILAAVVTLTMISFLMADQTAPRRTRPRGRSEVTGGLVMSEATGKLIRIFNTQKMVSCDVLKSVSTSITRDLWTPTDVVEMEAAPSLRKAVAEAFAQPRTGVAVIVVDNDYDAPILTAPERGWAIVNLRALATDAPSSDLLNARAYKEIWRACAFALGAGFSATTPCLLQQTHSLQELDSIKMLSPSPEQHNKLISNAAARGITLIKFATYRTACQQGWAPAPTNDIQRSIWEAVKTDKERGPAKPLTIPPPAKK